jgi:hypothetical protein
LSANVLELLRFPTARFGILAGMIASHGTEPLGTSTRQ